MMCTSEGNPHVIDDASAFVLKRIKFVKFIGTLSMINGTGPGAKVKTTPVFIAGADRMNI
jgi:hypothetical protein